MEVERGGRKEGRKEGGKEGRKDGLEEKIVWPHCCESI